MVRLDHIGVLWIHFLFIASLLFLSVNLMGKVLQLFTYSFDLRLDNCIQIATQKTINTASLLKCHVVIYWIVACRRLVARLTAQTVVEQFYWIETSNNNIRSVSVHVTTLGCAVYNYYAGSGRDSINCIRHQQSPHWLLAHSNCYILSLPALLLLFCIISSPVTSNYKWPWPLCGLGSPFLFHYRRLNNLSNSKFQLLTLQIISYI